MNAGLFSPKISPNPIPCSFITNSQLTQNPKALPTSEDMIPMADGVARMEESENSISCLQKHDDSASQGLGTPDSLLPPSEPPNIKDWFSSYEYESFVLETNDNFGFTESQGYGGESSSVENSRELVRGGENDDMMLKKRSSSMLNKCNQSEEEDNPCLNQVSDLPNSPVLSSEPPGIDKWFSSYAYESPSLEEDVILGIDDDKENMECCSNGNKLQRKEGDDLICNQILEEKSIKEVDNGSIRKVISPVEVKVKDENENVENGFVSVKSKREDVRAGRKNELKSSSSCVGNGKNKNKNKMNERKRILADVTNIEMTGKWKCPRKGKPDIGPPLKQLRLGQWFHHL